MQVLLYDFVLTGKNACACEQTPKRPNKNHDVVHQRCTILLLGKYILCSCVMTRKTNWHKCIRHHTLPTHVRGGVLQTYTLHDPL